jgi:hypothetical protein
LTHVVAAREPALVETRSGADADSIARAEESLSGTGRESSGYSAFSWAIVFAGQIGVGGPIRTISTLPLVRGEFSVAA